MKIFEFIDKFCQDLVQAQKERAALIDLSEFPHDGFIHDVSGAKVPCILIDGESVPVNDIFSMDVEDFVKAWKLPSARKEYTNYMSLVTVLEGEDVINRVRNQMEAEKARLSQDVELVTAI